MYQAKSFILLPIGRLATGDFLAAWRLQRLFSILIQTDQQRCEGFNISIDSHFIMLNGNVVLRGK